MSALEETRDHARMMAERTEDPNQRALWEQIADEIDAYLHPDTDTGPTLFEETP